MIRQGENEYDAHSAHLLNQWQEIIVPRGVHRRVG
jgi:hypothetical protein